MKHKTIYISIACILAIITIVFMMMRQNQEGNAEIIEKGSSVFTESYSDEVLPISFKYPKSHTVRAFSVQNDLDETVHTILVEGGTLESSVQIIATPYTGEKPITEGLIRREIPDMKMTDVQMLEIGLYDQGIAFQSDNAAFGNASREVWFVYDSVLYQISTYAKNDPFLKALFSTWQLL